MSTCSIPEGMIREILNNEVSSIRFEELCCDLFTEVDGIEYFPTSRSWDLGRDGRTLPQSSGLCGYLCCTTGGILDEKAEGDLNRLLKSTQPERVYFCTSHPESEYALQQVEIRLREIVGANCTVNALGSYQLVPLIHRHPEPFCTRYFGELREQADFVSQSVAPSGSSDVPGMQIALATQFDENAQVLRSQLVRQLVLRSLPPGTSKTLAVIAKSASDSLKLPRIIHTEYFREVVRGLVNDGLIRPSGEAFVATDAGLKALVDGQTVMTKGLDHGRNAIRRAIETLLGSAITDNEFEPLWRVLLDQFACLFFSQGLKIIQSIASLTKDEPHPATKKTFSELIESMRTKIMRLGVGGERSESIAQAVVDLFLQYDSEAWNWLTDVAVKYVSLCSLGLEPTAQQEVSGLLKKITLVLDTDVVLSYLSCGERPHQAIKDTVERWMDIGGGVLILPEVVEESAYHAWISETEYQEFWRELSQYGADEMRRYVRNAFVRAFYFSAEGRYEPKRWAAFIGEYRGQDEKDISVMEDILRDAGFDMPQITDMDIDAHFVNVVRDEIYTLRELDRSKGVSKQTSDKISRDCRILSYLKTARERGRSSRGTTVVISSSPILQKAARLLSKDAREPDPVWSVGALVYLVSLIPGVRLTLDILRRCLFDERESNVMDRVTQFAMRVIRKSGDYTLGYSRRATLKRVLTDKISKAAFQRGQDTRELVEEMMTSTTAEGDQTLAEVIADSVDTIQASRHEKENSRLKAENSELKAEIHRLRMTRKTS